MTCSLPDVKRCDFPHGITFDREAGKTPGIFNPAGNISLSAGDLAKYVLMHIRALIGRETVINRKIIVETHKAHNR